MVLTIVVKCPKALSAAASDEVYQLLAHGRLFSPGTPASPPLKLVAMI
jgi:hypothetical protein